MLAVAWEVPAEGVWGTVGGAAVNKGRQHVYNSIQVDNGLIAVLQGPRGMRYRCSCILVKKQLALVAELGRRQ